MFVAFSHQTLCCYELYEHLNGLATLCVSSGVQIQPLYSRNVIPGCMVLHATKGFYCYAYEASQDVAGIGHSEVNIIYCIQFVYNRIEGPLMRSARVLANPMPYEIGWFHEVSLKTMSV